MSFPEYKNIDLVEVNNSVLDSWQKEDAFRKVLGLREGAPKFIFFEGPPSANGMPGIHHVMARSIKDAVCRYKTQTGYLVDRKAGWDTHGLPVELGVEKMLGITKEETNFIKNPVLRNKFRAEKDKTGYDEPSVMGLTAAKAAYQNGKPWLL